MTTYNVTQLTQPSLSYSVIRTSNYIAPYTQVASYTDYKYRQWYRLALWRKILGTNGWLPSNGMLNYDYQKRKSTVSGSVKLAVGSINSTNWLLITGGYLSTISSLTTGLAPGATVGSDARLNGAVKSIAIAKAANAVGAVRINLPVAFAEFRQTRNLIATTAVNFVRAYADIRKGRFSRAAKRLGLDETPAALKGGRAKGMSPHERWLEYRYGWIPLLSDIKGSIEYLHEKAVAKQFYSVVKSTHEELETIISTLIDDGNVTRAGTSFRVSTKRTATITRKGIVTYRFRVTNQNLAQNHQLGLDNPALIAWELVPFSFVADWFVNVGDVLGQIGAFSGKECVDASLGLQYSEKSVKTTTNVATATGQSTYFVKEWKPATLTAEFNEYKRTVLNGFQTTTPSIRVKLGTERMLDAISLLKQRFR